MIDDNSKTYLRNNMVGFILGFVDNLPTCDACGPATCTNDEIREIFASTDLSDEALDKIRFELEPQLRFMRKNKERMKAIGEQFLGVVEDSAKEPKLRLVE